MNLLDALQRFFTIEKLSKSSLLLNVASIVMGVIYIIVGALGMDYIVLLWDIFGILILITFLENLSLVFINNTTLNKGSKSGKRFNRVLNGYLIFYIIAIGLMYQGNWTLMTMYSNQLRDTFRSLLYIYVGYFGILGYGTVISYYNVKNLNREELWDSSTSHGADHSISLRIFKFFLYLTLFLGLYFSYIIIFGYYLEITAFIAGMIVPELALFLMLVFLSAAILLLKLQDKEVHPKRYKAIALMAIIISGAHLLPLFSTPYMVYGAEVNFADAFGDGWHPKIDTDLEERYFMRSPFWLSGYFLGVPAKDCEYEKDVKFFDGKESNLEVDEEIELYFDVFWPTEVKNELPGVKEGKCAIIIFIHGGAWRYGDKSGSKIPVSKYFVAQGYVVYDIQYGLKDVDFEALATPEHVKGDFDVNDMVRHIGNFTRYISDDTNDYSAHKLDANLESVFVSGGSAGGHLTLATALGINSGEYEDIFGTQIKIKGMIPLYPGHPDLEGDKELLYPERYLLEEDSPPCLIQQGTQDPGTGEVSLGIKKEYEEVGKEECCILWLPFSGHSNDIYRPAYFNQVFTYYMERFMYLCIEGEIE